MTPHAPVLSPLDAPPDAPADEMRRREDAWRATHRAGALWPGLDERVIQSAADAVGTTVAAVLRDERATLELATTGLEAERSARAIGVAALLTGVGPLLGAWVAAGTLEAEEPIARVLARHLAHARAREARIRATVIPVLARMEHEGLEPAVIKGFHTAQAYFPEAGARPFFDVDVVVPPAAIPHAERLLADAGFLAEKRIGTTTYKCEWLPPDGSNDVWSYELWHARSRWKLDLHDGLNFLEVLKYGRAPAAPRFAEVLSLDGVTLRVPDANELIALLAAHASTELYSHRLLRLVELTLVVRRAASLGTLDWRAVASTLTAHGWLPFAYPTLALTERLAPGTVDPALLAKSSMTTTARARAVTKGLSPTAPILGASFSLRERLIWATGARATLRWLWRMIMPLEGASRSRQLRTYRHRAIRLLSLVAGRGRPGDDTH